MPAMKPKPTRRSRLARSITRIFFNGSMTKELMRGDTKYVASRVEAILKKYNL